MKVNSEKVLDLYFIAGTQDVKGRSLPEVLEEALEAGITCFQYREKGPGSLKNPEDIRQMAETCLGLCRGAGIPFVVNDDVSLAVEIGADGVHIGQEDLAIAETVKLVKGNMFIGLSVNTLEQLRKAAELESVDYIGMGPVYSTSTKIDAKTSIGLKLLEKAVEQKAGKPIVAIGGISEDRALLVRQTGVNGVAVISAITKSTDIRQTISLLKKKK